MALLEWLPTIQTNPWIVGVTAGVGAVLAYFVFRVRQFAQCTSQTDLTGKTVIVTGANSGIGYHTALDLARRNARVILACRREEQAEKAKREIVKATGNKNVVVRLVDIGSMASVRQFVQETKKEETRLDILVNNAGVYGLEQKISEDGLEINMAVNHFGHFLLTVELLDLLKKSRPSRIVNVSSAAHKYLKMNDTDVEHLLKETSVSLFRKYAATKLANLLFTRELAHRLDGTGVAAYAVHPGSVATNISRNIPTIFLFLFSPLVVITRTGKDGAQTIIYCAVSEDVKDQSGKYYADCALAENAVHPWANDPLATRKLWEVSERWTKPT